MKPNGVISTCALEAGVTVDDLRNGDRHHELVEPRKRISYILRKHHHLSLEAIAKLLNKDRSTIGYYVKTANGVRMKKRFLPDRILEDEIVEAYNESLNIIRAALKKDPLGSLLKMAEVLGPSKRTP